MIQYRIIILVLLCWLGAVGLNSVSRWAYPLDYQEGVRFVPNKEAVDVLSLGHQGLIADLLFIQVVQYTGGLMWKPVRFSFDSQWCYQMMDLVTRLDPQYYRAYLFAGMGLIHGPEDVKLARPILLKGMQHFPESWELPFWIGYGAYVYLEDYATAGEYFWKAANVPKAPKTFLSLMLSSLKKGGQYERAVWALERLIERTDDQQTQKIFAMRIQRMKQLISLEQAVERYIQQYGHFPEHLERLVEAGIIGQIPEDPMGKSYRLDHKNKAVVLANQ